MDAGPQLTALADPTRRAIFELVREAPASVRSLADRVPVSQPAVSQHLRVLRDAELVSLEATGGRHIYRADASGMRVLRAWLDSMWEDVLDAYAEAAEREVDVDVASHARTPQHENEQKPEQGNGKDAHR